MKLLSTIILLFIHTVIFSQNDIYWIKGDQIILFESNRGGDPEIFSFDLTLNKLKNLTDNNSEEGSLQVPLSEEYAFFSSDRNGYFQIYRMNLDGSNVINLTNTKRDELFPRVSPDGTLVAFMSTNNDFSQIYVVDKDGNNLKRVTNTQSSMIPDFWGKDNSQLIFKEVNVYQGKKRQLWGDPILGNFSLIFLQPATSSEFLTWTGEYEFLYHQQYSNAEKLFSKLFLQNIETNKTVLLSNKLPGIRTVEVCPNDKNKFLITTNILSGSPGSYLFTVGAKKPVVIGDGLVRSNWSKDGSKIALSNGKNLVLANSNGEIVKVLVE